MEPKGKGLGRKGGKGGIRVGKKKGGLKIISMYNVGRGWGAVRIGRTVPHREDK